VKYALAVVLGVVAAFGGAGYDTGDGARLDALPGYGTGPAALGHLYEATAPPQVDLVQPEPSASAALQVFTEDPVTKALVTEPAAVDGTITVPQAVRILLRETTAASAWRWSVLDEAGALVADDVVSWEPAEIDNGTAQLTIARNEVTLMIADPGVYRLEVTVNPGSGSPATYSVNITVTEVEDPPAASIGFEPGPAGEGLMPLNDWSILATFTLRGSGPPIVAPRILGNLVYTVFLSSDVFGHSADRDILELLEFGIYDRQSESVRWIWDTEGNPYGTVSDQFVTVNDLTYRAYTYTIDFYTNGYMDVPNLTSWPYALTSVPNVYDLVFRTSATLQQGTRVGFGFEDAALMCFTCERVDDLFRPYDENGNFVDGYPTRNDLNPAFFDPFAELMYDSIFIAVDDTGETGVFQSGGNTVNGPDEENMWEYPPRLYTPTAAHVRPRWDGVSQAFDMALGEWLELRTLFAMEDYVPVIGLNIHQTGGLAGETAGISEINLILTDIGADPTGPEGNGGFDPNTDLDGFTGSKPVMASPSSVKGRHFAFNGAWLWHDGNGNGIFDEPTKTAGNGVSYNDDRAMTPLYDPSYPVLNDTYEPKWEYIPYPPWQGDPAWKIRLRFAGYRDTYPGEPIRGYIEAVPDVIPSIADKYETMDYWIVLRPDSGYNDASLMTGDGTGMRPGADFRAFIEPRRWNPELQVYEDGTYARLGGWDGGILTSTQLVEAGNILGPMQVDNPWQNDPLWDFRNGGEPWWPERTLNPTNAKPQRSTLDVHDLVLTFDTDSRVAPVVTDIGYWTGGWSPGSLFATEFSRWMDPFGIVSGEFFYGNTVGTESVGWISQVTVSNVAIISNGEMHDQQMPYETVPFRNPALESDGEERLPDVYPWDYMRPLPTLPDYATWPPGLSIDNMLPPGRYPHVSDWPKALRTARLLTQKVDINSPPTAMLGLNLVGLDDPVTLRVIGGIDLTELTVAFWGPDFDPSDLTTLDVAGVRLGSGVMLFEDNGNGQFDDGIFGSDRAVAVRNLEWGEAPEPVDLNGDYDPDDLDGDGVYTAADNAWVLTFTPRESWRIPESDLRNGSPNVTLLSKSAPATDEFDFGGSAIYTLEQTLTLSRIVNQDGEPDAQPGPIQKALAPGGHAGDDLFIAISTSDKLKAGESFRAFVPWSLPGRPDPVQNRRAGVVLDAGSSDFLRLPADVLAKISPEENPVQDFYSHDMLEATVPATIIDLTADMTVEERALSPDDGPRALLGLDVTTNRAESVLVNGTGGTGGAATFTVPGATWTANQYRGAWLIDSLYHGYEIVGNTSTTLQLRYGQPQGDAYRIVQDPTFLEQVIIEFYDVDNDNEFDPDRNLLPMNQEDPTAGLVSGLSLYRDNEFHAANTPGVFDPGIDIPVKLDEAPYKIGATGEPKHQYMMVFSSPGTDNWPTPESGQESLRQWVPSSWNGVNNAAGSRADFFAVVRLARNVEEGDDFQMGIVSWGPDTPTAPDPDTFAVPQDTNQNANLHDLFTEFPWGSRALGFITFYEEPPTYYYLDRMTARQERDATGIPWIRSTSNVQQRTGVMTTLSVPPDLQIFSVNRSFLPELIPEGGLRLVITGISFGTSPVVTVDGVTLSIVSATDTTIEATIPAGSTFTPGENVELRVTNPVTVQFDTWPLEVLSADTLIIDTGSPSEISALAPPEGTDIVLTGNGFGTTPEVTFDGFPVIVTAANDIEISLTIPGGTLLSEPVEVVVFNPNTNQSDTRNDLFTLYQVVIESASTPTLPQNVPPSGTRLSLYGRGFGTQPVVTFNDDGVTVLSATDDTIDLLIPGGTFFPAGVPVLVEVTNPVTDGKDARDDLFIVVGPGAEPLAASIEITDLIKNNEALVPLMDWMPLFRVVMSHGEDDPTYRILKSLQMVLKADPRDEANYGRMNGLDSTDLLEFGVFIEGGDELVGTLDAAHDYLLPYSTEDGFSLPLTWDSTGAPVGELVSTDQGTLTYNLNFLGNGTPGDPQFPLTSAPGDGNAYIIAFRTSATWRLMLTLSYEVTGAEIVDAFGNFPRDDEGAVIDTYTPDFYATDPETLAPETAYSSSFAVWDVTGSPRETFQASHVNAWNWPQYMYTPLAEHTRPRWDGATPMMDFVTGEWLDIRRLFSLEEFVPLVGINIHSSMAVHVADGLRRGFHPYEGYNPAPAQPELMEVNVVLTDIGADPTKNPGNGGFDPREGLHRFTNVTWPQGAVIDPENAYDPDLTFNGLWVWHDSNNNAVFDPPTMNAGGGLTYNGDYPMFPESYSYMMMDDSFDSGVDRWENVMYPPGGGDPWWKIKLRFRDGYRRFIGENDARGYLDAVPDNVYTSEPIITTASDYTMDYFVVMHTDSGFKNASLGLPDGEGLSPGADTRAFIEPRRFNPSTGSYDGGIYVTSMIASPEQVGYGMAWQDDVRWGSEEPWWNQRTLNANNAKPVRGAVEVHDLVLTYSSSSLFAQQNELDLGLGFFGGSCFGYSVYSYGPTWFDLWLDPFGLLRSQFLNGHSVNVISWTTHGLYSFSFTTESGQNYQVNTQFDDYVDPGQYAFETVPFFIPFVDGVDYGPRSDFYPNPPSQPALPEYETWSPTLAPGEYPRLTDWAPEDRQARLLKQRVDVQSEHTAMLGINLAGVLDPVTNETNSMRLDELTVAFWGPDFHPRQLMPLDSDGMSAESGVLLWEDIDGDGVFYGRPLGTFARYNDPVIGYDQAVALHDLRWGSRPEPIDLDGDGVPDDMNGDGAVDSRDEAWVLTLRPQQTWAVPYEDGTAASTDDGEDRMGCFTFDSFKKAGFDFGPATVAEDMPSPMPKQVPGPKALDVTAPQAGDDLFISVRTSDAAPALSSFRAVIPATLPSRTEGLREAGLRILPQGRVHPGALAKHNPEEGAVQGFFDHDMLEVNVGVKITDLTGPSQQVFANSGEFALLGVDVSTNRPESLVASGTNGLAAAGTFTVANAGWQRDAFIRYWLIDSAGKAFRITANGPQQLELEHGREPQAGAWKIVRDATFLEQLMVEFYDESEDARFNVLTDLLPLSRDMRVSGVALFRDNDGHPDNRNGVYDPGVDLPVELNEAPRFFGPSGGPDARVRFIFSSPGTDDLPVNRAEQANLRQWVPLTWGGTATSADTGHEFFVVVRPSNLLQEDDAFSAGIVSWGPATPTEPDPDNFLGQRVSPVEIKSFREFPFAERGLGFITYHAEPPVYHLLQGFKARQYSDTSGYDWIRTSTSKHRRTGVLTALRPIVGPDTIAINSASIDELPATILPGQNVAVILYGENFGSTPSVEIGGYETTIGFASDSQVECLLTNREDVVPEEPVTVIVRNPGTKQQGTRSDLFRIVGTANHGNLQISSCSPVEGLREDFPVTVHGVGFEEGIQVFFGQTQMPIRQINAAGTEVVVDFPVGGLPQTGWLDVTVRVMGWDNWTVLDQNVRPRAFKYINNPSGGGCSSSGGSGGMAVGDLLVLAGMALGIGAACLRRKGAAGQGT
jgi:hypothetical protein